MRSGNPALNDKVFDRQREAARRPPVDDTVSPWPSPPSGVAADTMTLNGVVSASAVLLVLLLAAGWFGWSQVNVTDGVVDVPGWLLPAVLGGLAVALVTVFRPPLARFTAPLYALIEGLILGAVSHVYEFRYDGIVLQAVGLTIGVFVLLLVVYATGVIRATENFRLGVVSATGAVFLVYLVSLVLNLFGAEVSFIHDAGPVGILFSLVVVVIAALNLVLDFDFIEKGAAAGVPRYMEWYAAFGLLVTLVWLYLELLRLLGKARSR